MKESSLTLRWPRYPAKLIRPAVYQFTREERVALPVKEIRRWGAAVVHDLMAERKTITVPPVRGLATAFAGLQTEGDIDRFARWYGLLGLDVIERGAIDALAVGQPPWGLTVAEPLDIWTHHIENVRRLLMLYSALRDDALTRLEELLVIRGRDDFPPEFRDTVNPDEWDVIWRKDGRAAAAFCSDGRPDIRQAAVAVLVQQLTHNLQGGIHVDYSRIVENEKAAIGFRIQETRTTSYLLAAIYFDLWELITESRRVRVCKFCGLPVTGKKKYCNAACKQADYRRRLKERQIKETREGGV